MNNSIFEYADQNNIFVEYKNIPENKSLSTSVFGVAFIALDYSLLFDESAERSHLAHELGHCKTGSFYNIYSDYDVREKHEYKADKWAVHEYIKFEEYQQAIQEGYTEVWQLAERFNVTEDFIRRADYIYRCENKIA